MPQLDNLTYLPQVFWVVVFFSFWYALSSLCILPSILQNVNTRQLMLTQTNEDGSGASEGLTNVFNAVAQSSFANGEEEAADRHASVSTSRGSLFSGEVLCNSLKNSKI